MNIQMCALYVLNIRYSNFVFVSDFDIRVSNLNYIKRILKNYSWNISQFRPCLPLNNKPGVVQIFLVVDQRFSSIEIDHAGSGTFGNGLPGSRIPLHGGTQAGV